MPTSLAHDIFRRYGRGVPVDVISIAKELDMQVIPEPDLSVCGEAAIEHGVKVIRYRSSDSLVRQRFTIAHEIGHHLLGHTVSGKACRDERYIAGTDIRETDANAFAAELLVPRVVLDMVLKAGKASSIEQLARAFNVSGAVMAYRLKALGYISTYA